MTDPHRHSVLLVDDYENGRRGLALYLDAKGYNVHGAVDGSDALLLLATGLRPCCAVVDINMPDMDGWTLIARLRGDPAFRALPIVICSGNELTSQEASRARAVGVCAHFVKSVDPNELLAALVANCEDSGHRNKGTHWPILGR